MKTGRVKSKLGEIYDVRDGTHDSPKYHAVGYPLIISKNLKPNGLSFDDVKLINDSDFEKINERSSVNKGDVLFAMIGTIGNPTLVDVEPNFAIKNVALFKIAENQSGPFLKYYLESDWVKSKMVAEANGTTQRFVGLGYLRNFPIELPPLSEQHRIVAILDEAFDSIATAKANAEKNLQNARALFESHLQAVFSQRGDGWKEAKFSDLCSIKYGFAFKSEFFATEGDFVLLTPGNFYESGGYRDRGEKQKFYVGEIPQDYILNAGDLLVAMTEQAAGLLGSPILVPESGKFLHNQRLGLVTKKDHVPWSNEFFSMFSTRSLFERKFMQVLLA